LILVWTQALFWNMDLPGKCEALLGGNCKFAAINV